MDLKKDFLWAGIGAVSISALVAVFIVLFGKFGELEAKLFVTTLTVGWYSLAASISFSLRDSKFLAVKGAGLCVALIGAMVTLSRIWADARYLDEGDAKLVLTLFIISFSVAHISIVLKSLSGNMWQNGVIFGTVCFVAIVGAMLIHLILDLKDWNDFSDMYFRVLTASAILDFLGTALVPIIKKLTVESQTVRVDTQ